MTVLIFSRDPGAANQILALYELLYNVTEKGVPPANPNLREFAASLPMGGEGCGLLVYAKDYAVEIWRQAGLAPEEWDKAVPRCAPRSKRLAAIRDLLRANGVRYVITGAGDYDDSTNQEIWEGARLAGTPSAVFLDDCWVEHRFIGADGTRVFPDKIFAVDEKARSKLRRMGVANDRIVVFGNLHLERFRRRAETVTQAQIDAVRREWDASTADKVVLFASQAWDETKPTGERVPYSEFECLADILERIENGARLGEFQVERCHTLLVVRPHPKDRDGKYDRYVSQSPARTIVSRAGPSESAILAADLIVGMTSIFLDESEALNKPVVRLVDPDALDRNAIRSAAQE